MIIQRAPGKAEQPFTMIPQAARNASVDVAGAFSIETYCDVGALSFTHDDAQGWLNYLVQFQPNNFWYQDGYVQPWAYYEEFDNWEDTYGADAVLAVYHSGHGGMNSAGRFSVPMGADWGGLGCTAFSDQMRLGNEQANYIFWSTCESLRVLGGHSPFTTWSAANLGFRMMFGYETVSWDDPNYGQYFWEEWQANKSFSTAFCDASWRIAHDQAPSVVACGASEAEAQDRLWNERALLWDHASTAWWWWRWYTPVTVASGVRAASRALPDRYLIAELTPPEVTDRFVRAVIDRFGLAIELPAEVTANGSGQFVVEGDESHVSFRAGGDYEVQLAPPNRANRTPLELAAATSAADEAISRYGLDQGIDLTFDRVRHEYEGGRSVEPDAAVSGPYLTSTTVQYAQVINGLPVITPGTGVLVSLDNDGAVTRVQSATRQVARLSDRPRNTTANPPEYPGSTSTPAANGAVGLPRAASTAEYESLLDAEWSKQAQLWANSEQTPVAVTIVPDSTEVGYDIRGNVAAIIARRAVEVDFGGGYRKRYWVTTPIFE